MTRSQSVPRVEANRALRTRICQLAVATGLLLCLPACSYLESEFSTLDRMPQAFAQGAPDRPASAVTRP